MKILKVLSIVLLLWSPIFIYGQIDYFPGYVVMESGDTIHGEIRDINEYSNCKTIKFRDSLEHRIKFKKRKVKLYYCGYDTYVKMKYTRLVLPRKAYMKILQDGEAILYVHHFKRQYFGPSYLDSATRSIGYKDLSYYIEIDDKIKKISPAFFRMNMMKLLNDDEEILRRLKEREYNYDDIEDAIYVYNQRKSGRW
ncbi:hypothetical protein JXE04_04125 [Patescibacteria group bacterium]|nr:hypothetical protein [Patescibacteria group bacterium]